MLFGLNFGKNFTIIYMRVLIKQLLLVTELSNTVSPISSAVISPDFGFLTESIRPTISAFTSEYSKAKSHPSVLQLIKVSPLQ